MGQCTSSGAAGETAARAPPSKDTALVLMPSGEMREYPRPTIAARVLEDAAAASTSTSTSSAPEDDDWFLCDADGMGFEGAVTAVRGAELLRAGQIYFVLPAAARRQGLRREEVAALAVRASAALSSRAAASASASGKRRRGAVVAPLVFAPPDEEDERREALEMACKAAAATPVRRPAPRVRSGGRLERFASDLTAIPECERDDERDDECDHDSS